MKKNKYTVMAACALTVVWIAFIWWNSMQSGGESGAMSGSVTVGINAFLSSIGIGIRIPQLLVRKAAHFLEFAMLASLLSFDALCVFDLRRHSSARRKCLVWWAFPCAVAVASVDETIQLFVEGRVGSVIDVMIDSGGALTAVSLWFLALMLMKNKSVE